MDGGVLNPRQRAALARYRQVREWIAELPYKSLSQEGREHYMNELHRAKAELMASVDLDYSSGETTDQGLRRVFGDEVGS